MSSSDLALTLSGTAAYLLSFGLAGAGVLAVAERFAPLLPSYVLLMFLGLTVPDNATLLLTIGVTTLGSIIGGLGWYMIGWLLGPERVRKAVAGYGRYVLLKLSLYDRLTSAYRRNHFWVTLSGQIMPAVRLYLPLPAGVLRLNPKTFLAATSLGCLLWNAPFLYLGYVLRGGERDPIQTGFWASIILLLIEGAILLTVRFRNARNARADS